MEIFGDVCSIKDTRWIGGIDMALRRWWYEMVRSLIYRVGIRPSRTSFWYSARLSTKYAFAGVEKAFQKGVKKYQKRVKAFSKALIK